MYINAYYSNKVYIVVYNSYSLYLHVNQHDRISQIRCRYGTPIAPNSFTMSGFHSPFWSIDPHSHASKDEWIESSGSLGMFQT